ncbi:hypothetical protein HD806DRAFT_520108 [Xylariaceae sp. AK1471]|nr:hypothetical protein HD806DRAFT_520108 [Xylariaceae sp. AK1471]
MPGVLLFCTAEEAKSFVPQVLATDKGEGFFPYFLAESRQGPAPGKAFKERLTDDETFETEFIALEQQGKNKMVEQDKIVILDARSAKDQTITMWFYIRDVVADLLPDGQKPNTWHAFRIPYLKAFELAAQLPYTDADETYGVFLHRKDELTDERGIFDFDKAIRLCNQGEGLVPAEEST